MLASVHLTMRVRSETGPYIFIHQSLDRGTGKTTSYLARCIGVRVQYSAAVVMGEFFQFLPRDRMYVSRIWCHDHVIGRIVGKFVPDAVGLLGMLYASGSFLFYLTRMIHDQVL